MNLVTKLYLFQELLSFYQSNILYSALDISLELTSIIVIHSVIDHVVADVEAWSYECLIYSLLSGSGRGCRRRSELQCLKGPALDSG